MNEETIRLLIEQKITFVNTTANACMLWWVSSIVFLRLSVSRHVVEAK